MGDPHSEAMGLEALSAAACQPGTLQCCCGNKDCVFLKHNCSVLDSVEKDVHTAARLGQVRGCCQHGYSCSVVAQGVISFLDKEVRRPKCARTHYSYNELLLRRIIINHRS